MSGIEMTMKRQGQGLFPTCAIFEEDLASVPEGKEVFISIRMVRNGKFLAWWESAISQVVKSGQWHGDRHSLKRWIKMAIGHYDETIMDDGKVCYEPRSWSVYSMDELSFRDLVDRAKYVLADQLGINMDEIFDRADSDVTPNDPAQKTTAPCGMSQIRFDETFLDRLTALHMQLRQCETVVDMESFYEANRDEFGALVQIDRDCVASVYSASLRRAKGNIGLDEEITCVNDLLNRHEDKPA